MQEWGRRTYERCEVCGNQMACLHHFIPKAISTRLRYDQDNLVPVCHPCHMRIENKDRRYDGVIIQKRGKKWHDRILLKARETVKADANFYKQVIDDYVHKDMP